MILPTSFLFRCFDNANYYLQKQVITATDQLVLNIISHAYLKVSDINLIIFDECHHARGKCPMLMLMAKFQDYPEEDHPRVIGLTGMLTRDSIKPHDVSEDLKDLEKTLRSTITTAKGAAFDDVLKYSTRPVESVLSYESHLPTEFQECIIRRVDSMIELIKNWPLDNTHQVNGDNCRDEQTEIQIKYEYICKELKFQMRNLGKQERE